MSPPIFNGGGNQETDVGACILIVISALGISCAIVGGLYYVSLLVPIVVETVK